LSPSFGHTCAGRAKAAALLSLLALLLSALPLQAGFAAAAPGGATPLTASSSLISSSSLSLGYGPSSLSPVSNGVPVYTVGDTVWAESGYNYSIPLSVTSARAGASVPARVVAVRLLDSQVITPLYTFTAKDKDGIWNITLGSLRGTVVIPVRFVNLADHPVSLGPLLYSLNGGNISISAQANLGDSYDQEVCAGGNATSAGVSLSLPTDMRNAGNITLTPGNPFDITATGQVNESFTFWVELFHPYSLDAVSANSLVINDLKTAQSQPVAFVSAGATNTTLTWNMPPREGRYDLRAFFQNSTSLEVVQSRVLIMNATSSWVSLSEACQPQVIQSQNVSYSASLTNGQDNWPRSVYVMYRTFGVESFAAYPVNANLSSVDFVASPWNTTLQDIKVNVSPGAGILQTSQDGSSLFVLASHYPAELNYSVDISGGHNVAQGSLTVNQGYATQTNKLKLAKLTVHILSDQSALSTLEVTGPQGVNITSGLVGSNQTSFLLPTGSYTVTALQAGNTQSAQVSLTDGLASAVTLNFNTFLSLEVILIVTAIMAAGANVLTWILRSRSLSSRLAASK
jgi:hypothetical protein